MPIQVEAPDRTIIEFPDGMDDDAIATVMRSQFPGKNNLGMAQPTQREPETSQILGFEQGVGNFIANAGRPAIAAGEALGIPMGWAREGAEILRNPSNPEGKQPGGIGRFVADVSQTAPTMLAGPLAGGALSGYLLSEGDTPQDMATSAALGAAGGKLGDKLMRGIASTVSPTVSKYAKALMDEGVRLTPGQIRGGALQRTEEKLSSIPFLGDTIANARIRGIEDFNKAAINRSLGPIGAKLPDDIAGRDAVDFASKALSDSYTNLLRGATFKPDQAYTQNVANLVSLAKNIPEYGNKPLTNFIATNITPRISKAGSISGNEFKEVDSLLGQEAKEYLSSPSPNDRKLGQAFKQLQAELKDALGRSNPAIKSQLDDTNEGFANLVRIQNAASRGGGAKGVDPGVFTPSQLAAAVKASDSSVRKNAVSRGNALMQDLSDAGAAILPQQVPDSGTPGRIAAMLLAGGTLGNVVSPAAAVPIAALTGAYTKPGIKAMEYALARRPTQAAALANILRNNAGATALPASVLAAKIGSGE